MSLYVDIEKDLGSFLLSVQFEAENNVTGILGASGSGKSMTLRCIAGIVKPDRGKIMLDGITLFDSEKKIHLPPQKRHVGLLFQNYALFPNMTVEKNLMAGLRAAGKDKKNAKKAAAEMIERFYLTGLENLRPFQLSGGQQQRAALARILLTKPKLLMLDEPFSALDGYLRWKLELELMDILKEFGGTTLFVSHSRDEIYRLCGKACVMEQGRSTPAVPVKTMFEKPETLASCMLSGCKNYSEAKIVLDEPNREGRWIYAENWGIKLDCGRRIPENISHIGIRSHYIQIVSDKERETEINVFPSIIRQIIEDVFTMIIMVNFLDSRPSSQLRLEMPKNQWMAYAGTERGKVGDILWIQIKPQDILLLRK